MHTSFVTLEAPARRHAPGAIALTLERKATSQAELLRRRAARMFKDSLLEQNRVKSSSKTLDLVISITLHVVILSALVLSGLYFTQTINLKDFTSTLLVAPPPPPPPPPAPAQLMKVSAPRHLFTAGGKLLAPAVIPKQIAIIKEAPLPPETFGGVEGGVPGGVPGGSLGGVIGGVLGGIGPIRKPVAPPTQTRRIVRVGGRVRPPKIIRRVEPVYPTLARIAHIQGNVVVDAILDEQGNVTEMKVVSGPPLLYQAALEALAQWKYEPTYLNDQPVAVQFIVTISFRLN